ncbi:transposase [Streptomyces sp. NPDC059832]|uniref:transposase n=1 Tax=unclassified Streptomyces TaxID=2593676 RepID=UPI00364A3B14
MRVQRKLCQVGGEYTKRYSEEYKRDAVDLVRSPGRTATEVARELGEILKEATAFFVKESDR